MGPSAGNELSEPNNLIKRLIDRQDRLGMEIEEKLWERMLRDRCRNTVIAR
jgi:hypothetical protein